MRGDDPYTVLLMMLDTRRYSASICLSGTLLFLDLLFPPNWSSFLAYPIKHIGTQSKMLNCVISLDPKMVLNPVLEAFLLWYCIILMHRPAFLPFPYVLSDSPLPKKTVSVSPGSSDSPCLKHQPPFPCSHPWAFGWCCSSLTLSLFLTSALSLPLCPVHPFCWSFLWIEPSWLPRYVLSLASVWNCHQSCSYFCHLHNSLLTLSVTSNSGPYLLISPSGSSLTAFSLIFPKHGSR